MRPIFLDTEFIESGHSKPVYLLSLGLIDLDGKSYYAEDEETDQNQANDWVRSNVLPHLQGPKKSRASIKADLLEYLGDFSQPQTKPVFWGYFSSYDWVLFAQLFGTMAEMPKDLPYLCFDLKQYAESLGVRSSEFPKQEGQEHNALADALWNRDLYRFLLKRHEDIQRAMVKRARP